MALDDLLAQGLHFFRIFAPLRSHLNRKQVLEAQLVGDVVHDILPIWHLCSFDEGQVRVQVLGDESSLVLALCQIAEVCENDRLG